MKTSSSLGNTDKKVFGMLIGTLYVLFGLLQILAGLGLATETFESLYIPGELFSGFVLLVIGAVFLYGFKELSAGVNEGVAYIYVGILLALIFVLIYLFVMGANALETYVVESEDFEGWTPLDDMRPGLFLGIFPLFGFLKWKSKFTLKRLSKAGA
jgi:hypothetical protein